MGGRVSESKGSVVAIERIESRILLVRGHKVLLDADLAALYEVSTKRFNEQVRRNAARFPEDFMFRLSAEEWDSLRSQFATLKTGRGQHRKYLPLAFTEHGAIMAATILNGPRATEVSVYVVRAFVRLRELLAQAQAPADRVRQSRREDAQLGQCFGVEHAHWLPPEPRRHVLDRVAVEHAVVVLVDIAEVR